MAKSSRSSTSFGRGSPVPPDKATIVALSGGMRYEEIMMSVNPRTSALLVMDYQKEIVSVMAPEPEVLLAHAAKVVGAARAVSMPVIYVVVGFRPGYPELNPRNERLSTVIRQRGGFVLHEPASAVHPAVAPKDGDAIVVKRRVSAFSGSDLEILLRSLGVDTLVLMGLATSGVVLSTTRHAFDADYRILVLEDCCADPDAEVHRVLCEKILARQSSVMGSGAFMEALSAVSA